MAYIVGIDEAGYGPNLGPLVVAGTVWSTEQQALGGNLYEVLHPEIDGNPDTPGLTICDSKRLHQSQRGLARLEENVLAIWSRATQGAPHLQGHWPAEVECLSGGAMALDWQSLQRVPIQPSFWDDHAAESSIGAPAQDEWYYLLPEKLKLPVAGCLDRMGQGSEMFDRATRRAGVSLVRVAYIEISPRQFNHLLTRLGSKGTLLTGVSLLLAGSLLADCKDQPTHVICDKHGGRNRYGQAIHELLGCRSLCVESESESSSRYQVSLADGSPIEWEFRARGESSLPTALASMVAKYIRELRMEAWNRFWRLRVPDVAPTKGYPQDAKRFLEQIRPALCELQAPVADVWRNK